MSADPEPIIHPLLADRGVSHGFGVKGWPGPAGLVRPRQVHGVAVATISAGGGLEPEAADAVLAGQGEPPVGVVTADCVPILLASRDGGCVGAIHAGWRGLAAGVVDSALAAWQVRWASTEGVAAVIGPHARACCYEVDAPVERAFLEVEATIREPAFTASRPGHWMLDLSLLTRAALRRGGIGAADIGEVEGACTVCNPDLFESFRRDGEGAARLVHAITPRAAV